jgi:hypothetical protein
VVERGRYRFLMLQAATLELSVLGRVGGPGKAQVILLPDRTNVARSYPWYELNPVEVVPGQSVVLDDLPAGRLRLRVFHQGALAKPEDKVVTLRNGETTRVAVELVPAPKIHGVVTDAAGRPLERARVWFEAPDRVAAMTQYLGQLPMILENEVYPTLAPAAQETETDAAGRFTFSSWPRYAPARYLTATSRDGKLWGGRIVSGLAGDGEGVQTSQEVRLVLKELRSGLGELTLEFPGRTQGVPLEITVDGVPLEPRVLPAGDPLVLPGLPQGTWRLTATWNGSSVLGGSGSEELVLGEELDHRIRLPRGAIEGQDAETRLRAGRAGPPSHMIGDTVPIDR